MLTREMVLELLAYDRLTGEFTWKVGVGNRVAGSRAGQPNSKRYTQIGIGGKKYLAHRLAWLVECGYWPKDQIDHINRIRHDNRLANLRECDNKANCENRSTRS